MALNPQTSVERRTPTSGVPSKQEKFEAIGDEPINARTDQEPSEEALLSGEMSRIALTIRPATY